MKYLRRFEENDSDWNVGDYVKIDSDGWHFSDTDSEISLLKKFFDDEIGVITEVIEDDPTGLSDNNYPFIIEFPSEIPSESSNEMSFDITELKRIANSEEIELYKIKKDSNKYNL